MLHHLSLTFFRRHRSLDIDFTSGLNALRGANEQGKSTVLESVLYALYGSRALRTPLAEAVTWGQRETEMKVVLVLSVQGKEYTFERSKGGATVYVAGQVHTTGQNEVSAVASDILGADAKTAAMLMMAGQADLHGALAEGPAAVSALIGKLADFNIIDTLIENAQSRLLLGTEAPFIARLADQKAALETLEASAPDERQIARLRASEAALGEVLAQANAKLDAARTVVDQRDKEHQAGLALASRVQALEAKLQAERSKISALSTRIADADVTVASAPTREELDAASAALDLCRRGSVVTKVYSEIRNLPAYPKVFWEGPRSEMAAELAQQYARASEASGEVRTLDQLIQAALKRRITSGVCPTCGHAANSDEHVAEINAGVDAEVAELRKARAEAAARRASTRADIAALEGVVDAAAPFLLVADKVANTDLPVHVDRSVFPPRVTWVGEAPDSSLSSTADAERRLQGLRDLQQRAAQAQGSALELRAQVADAAGRVRDVEEELSTLAVPDLEPLHAAYHSALLDMNAAVEDVNHAKEQMATTAVKLQTLTQDAAQHAVRVEAARRAVATLEADIATLARNNVLLRKLRTIKPAITDHLWSIVLSSVSTFFSQLRGDSSMVSKDKDGFKVNGRPVEALSGSTLDALAIAVRVALTKTFVPHAPFIVLDEPCHGADVDRTSNILAFLAGAGFTQTILASHDPLSESVAQNVINL